MKWHPELSFLYLLLMKWHPELSFLYLLCSADLLGDTGDLDLGGVYVKASVSVKTSTGNEFSII